MNISLQEMLAMLASGVATGAVLAFLLEKVAWFQNLSPATKTWATILICLSLPFIGWLGGMGLGYTALPASLVAWAEGVFHELAIGFLTWAASQGWHLLEKAARS